MKRNIVARWHDIVCYENATIRSFCIADLHEAVNVQSRSVMTWKRNNGFHLHCCQPTKYFVLLSKT